MLLEAQLLLAFQAVVTENAVRFDCSDGVKDSGKNRAYECSVSTCSRMAYAKNLCNAHYLRARNGKDLSTPLERKLKGRTQCKTCDVQLDSRGGWGFCGRHYKMARNKALKAAAVEIMGNCCADCKKQFPQVVYDFHHIKDKTGNPGEILSNKRLEIVAKELGNCVLLCANCHRIRHQEERQV